MRQSGKSYTNRSGKIKEERHVDFSKNCNILKCKLKCQEKVSREDQRKLCAAFWDIGNDSGQKLYLRDTIHQQASNKRNRKSFVGKRSSQRTFTLQVDGSIIQVCKQFYLTTHAISHSRITTLFTNLLDNGNPCPRPTLAPPNKSNAVARSRALQHINSIPKVESHYCRQQLSDSKFYVDGTLTQAEMYRLYKQWVIEGGHNIGDDGSNIGFVSEYTYNEILNFETNISFHKPKSDLCDKCQKFESLKKTGLLSETQATDHESHMKSKDETRKQRHIDTNELSTQESYLVVSFDLENVFSLPRCRVSSAFYKRKLNTYNLTAVVNKTGKGYCAIWPENLSGRSGNDIASALVCLIKEILVDHPDCRHLILWSDSCVPQNRNSIMSYALLKTLENSQLISIVQRFCEPGHSSIQDVDNLHSLIERSLRNIDIFSPISLVRHLKANKYKGHQMYVKVINSDQFSDFSSIAKLGFFNRVPYSGVKEIMYHKANLNVVTYKKSFSCTSSQVEVMKRIVKRDGSVKPLPKPKVLSLRSGLSDAKAADIRSLLIYMTGDDYTYMSNLCQGS